MGIFKSDFSRNSGFVALIRNFVRNNNPFTAWSHFSFDFTYCRQSVRNGNNALSNSCIDHFILQNSLFKKLLKAQAIH